MNLPNKPPAWANRISRLLQEVQKFTGEDMYPVYVRDIAADISKQFFPEAPITKISGEDFKGGFEGMLHRVPQTKGEWGIVYNTAIKSPGRINFTIAHELGHYLLHRMALEEGRIQCNRQDMFRWNSEHGQREAEANEFSSYLLMPRNLFENQIKGQEISLALLQHVADYFNVSLTAAILKWLEFTSKRAMIVVGKDGFIDWVWSSKPLRKSFVGLQPKKEPIELPAQSLAVRKDTLVNDDGILHAPGVWPFKEEVREMSVSADTYDMTITLLLFPDDAPNRWVEPDEEPDLLDAVDKFNTKIKERTW